MTHHTDAELLPCPFCGCKAHFEMDDCRWEWIECGSCGMQGNRSASVKEDCKPKLAEEWNLRAPAAPAPQGYDSGVQTGNRVTLAFDTQSNATAWFEKFCDDYDAAAGTKTIKLPIPADAAPQPPDAAPVQLPEPDSYKHTLDTTEGIPGNKPEEKRAESKANPFGRKGIDYDESFPWTTEKLYTEQQVRELLAAHGIKVNQ